MLPDDAKVYRAAVFAFFHEGVGGAPERIIAGADIAVVGIGAGAKRYDAAAKPLGELFNMVNLAVDDQTPVIRKEFGKPSKRVTDILNILKEVHMVLLNVQDNADVREKAQKGVGVLACLRHEIVGLADTDIAADGL